MPAPASTTDSQGLSITQGGNPTFNFTKQQTFGYSLNGREFLVAQGVSYTAVKDSIAAGSAFNETYQGTSMAILGGTNGSSAATNYGKALTKAIDTGWVPAAAGLRSDVLNLWGMAEMGASNTDTYALSMSFDSAGIADDKLNDGDCYLVTKDAGGNWVNAVDANAGGTKSFVLTALGTPVTPLAPMDTTRPAAPFGRW